MKPFLFAFLLSFIAFFASSQGVFKFKTENYDFGDLIEGEQASHEFEFQNVGKAPLLISNVQPSCGCTTPEWPKEPIMPGAKGKIKATYNTSGRPGGFNKSISVSSNAEPASLTLFIKGMVVKKEDKPVFTEVEIKNTPHMVLSKTEHTFGKVERGQKVSIKVEVKNLGKSELVIKEVTSACNCVTYTLSAPSVPVGKSAVLEFFYTPRVLNDVTDIVQIRTNDVNQFNLKFPLKALVVENLSTPSILKQNGSSNPFK